MHSFAGVHEAAGSVGVGCCRYVLLAVRRKRPVLEETSTSDFHAFLFVGLCS